MGISWGREWEPPERRRRRRVWWTSDCCRAAAAQLTSQYRHTWHRSHPTGHIHPQETRLQRIQRWCQLYVYEARLRLRVINSSLSGDCHQTKDPLAGLVGGVWRRSGNKEGIRNSSEQDSEYLWILFSCFFQRFSSEGQKGSVKVTSEI